MPPEAWVALIFGVIGFIGTLIAAVWYLSGQLASVAEIPAMKTAIDNIERALQAVAVQDAAIQTMREQNLVNQRRQDETNNRIFAILDRLQSSRIATT